MFFNSSKAQEIYEDRISVGCSEKWATIATIDEPMPQQTWQEIEYRLDVLRVTKGAHIEMY